jgi:hypothetical protein
LNDPKLLVQQLKDDLSSMTASAMKVKEATKASNASGPPDSRSSSSASQSSDFVSNYVAPHAPEMKASRQASIVMVLSELMIENEDDLEDIEWLTLVTHCQHSASQSSILDVTRVRKFLSSLKMPNFGNDDVAFHMYPSSPPPSALKGGFDTPLPGRKGRKSGIFMAQDLLPGVSTNDSSSSQAHDTFVDGTSRRHAGGQSERDQISSQCASDGGGPGGFGIGENIHDPQLKSAAALKQQETVRLKMVTNASVKIPEWNGEAEDWFDFSPLFIRRMENAGYGCVCLPDFLETAKGFGWNQADIVEAKKFVAMLCKCTKRHGMPFSLQDRNTMGKFVGNNLK